MEDNKMQKCRTCLKNSTKILPLTKQARGCNPTTTYGQILQEYAKLESSSDYEHLMPQYLCFLCCRELRNTCNFIRQAQYCNIKLLTVISKKLDCLQEKTIDLPESGDEVLEKSIDIKLEQNNLELQEKEDKVLDTPVDAIDREESNVLLKSENMPESLDKNFDDKKDYNGEKIEDIESDHQTDSLSNFSTPNTSVINLNEQEEQSESPATDTECPICHKIMSRRDNLLTHMRTQHDIESPSKLLQQPNIPSEKGVYKCKLCPSKYTNKYSLLYHMKNKHSVNEEKKKVKEKCKEKIIKCRSCDYTARTYAALNYHNRSKHGSEEDKFKCTFCNYMSFKKFDLLTHVKNTHKELIKTLKAEQENKQEEQKGETLNQPNTLNTFANSAALQHEVSCSDENEDTNFSSSDDDIPLAQKLKQSPVTSTSLPQMELEHEEFSDGEFIRNILNIKRRQPKTETSKSLARRCEECGNIYKDYKALYAHQRHVHISEDKYSLCPHCGKKYKRKTDLKIHIEKSHIPKTSTNNLTKRPAKVREKRFMCTECSYVCATITILNIHRNRHHTGEKPYKCDICFKSFIVPFDLKTHRYLHTGERPYKCPICSKGFRDNSHMIKHKRIHSSEKPYKCKECGKSFTQSYNLSVHKRTHLKEKKLNCTICDKVFENRSLLNLHRINENHHDDEVV